MSMAIALSLICTFFFPTLRSQEFVKFARVTIFCYFLTNLALSVGFPPNGTVLCKAQSVIWIYFFFASVTWFTLMAYHFFSMWVVNRPFNFGPLAHVIAWSLPCVPTFIPLIHLSLGRSEVFGNLGPCTFDSPSLQDFLNWGYASLFGVSTLLIAVGSTLIGAIYVKHHKIGKSVNFFLVVPVISVAFWAPFLVVSILVLVYPSGNAYLPLSLWMYLLGVQEGNAFVIALYACSPEIRRPWWRLLVDGTVESPLNFEPTSKVEASLSALRSSLIEDHVGESEQENVEGRRSSLD